MSQKIYEYSNTNGIVTTRYFVVGNRIHGKYSTFTEDGKKLKAEWYECGKKVGSDIPAEPVFKKVIRSGDITIEWKLSDDDRYKALYENHVVYLLRKSFSNIFYAMLDPIHSAETGCKIVKRIGCDDTVTLCGESTHVFSGEKIGEYKSNVPIGRHECYYKYDHDGYVVYDNGVPVEFNRKVRINGVIVGSESLMTDKDRSKVLNRSHHN